MPRLQEIHANLVDRLREARDQGWLGEVAAIETTMAAAAQKLEAMRDRAAQPSTSACPTSAATPDEPAPSQNAEHRRDSRRNAGPLMELGTAGCPD
jgi:hypothetical protein